MTIFQPTLPARGATTTDDCYTPPSIYISTHAPRTGSDADRVELKDRAFLFQPTLPARGATRKGQRAAGDLPDFNPRSPHGERPCPVRCPPDSGWYFNPRSPHGERRPSARSGGHGSRFQPTLPARGATADHRQPKGATHISTHAPRTGSDDFVRRYSMGQSIFQPTLPARGATLTRLKEERT